MGVKQYTDWCERIVLPELSCVSTENIEKYYKDQVLGLN